VVWAAQTVGHIEEKLGRVRRITFVHSDYLGMLNSKFKTTRLSIFNVQPALVPVAREYELGFGGVALHFGRTHFGP